MFMSRLCYNLDAIDLELLDRTPISRNAPPFIFGLEDTSLLFKCNIYI